MDRDIGVPSNRQTGIVRDIAHPRLRPGMGSLYPVTCAQRCETPVERGIRIPSRNRKALKKS